MSQRHFLGCVGSRKGTRGVKVILEISFFGGEGEIGVVMLEIKKFIKKFLSLEEARITGV